MSQSFSVVMPVRNAGPHLDSAIRSILSQSRGDFEFIIGDDGSTDGSRELARDWARRDERIRLIECEGGHGPVAIANRVASEARHPLVARMDADDLSCPGRFERQLAILERQPDAVLVGSLFDSIDASGRMILPRDRSVLIRASWRAPVAHGSIMYRRDAFERAGGYREHCSYFEDFDLYLRMARQGKVLIVPEPMLLYRFSATSGRLCAREQVVEEALSYYFECINQRRHAEERFPAIRRGDSRPVAVEAVVALATLRLWAGHRPAIIGRLLRRGTLGWNRKSARALLWSLWATASPGSLRASHRFVGWCRDVSAGRKVDNDRVYEWNPEASVDRTAAAGPSPTEFAAVAAAR